MEAPKEYKDAGAMLMFGGALNIITAGIWVLSLIWVCIGIMWLVPMAVGAWQAFVGWKMYSGEVQGTSKIAAIAGMVSAFFNLNPIAFVCGLLGMLNVDKPDAKAFLEHHGA